MTAIKGPPGVYPVELVETVDLTHLPDPKPFFMICRPVALFKGDHMEMLPITDITDLEQDVVAATGTVLDSEGGHSCGCCYDTAEEALLVADEMKRRRPDLILYVVSSDDEIGVRGFAV